MPVVVCRHGATRGMLAILFCILAAAIAVFSPAPSKTLARLLDSARELLYAKGNKESHPVVESKGGEKASDVLMLKDALQYLDADLFNKSKVPIYANAFRRKILQSFGWPELSGKLCPCKESSLLHVLPISCLHHEHLKEYLKTCKQQFKTVLAFCPTGWTYSERTKSHLDLIRPVVNGNVTIYGVPYSEHSSFTELREFVKFLKPKKIIPTVNAGNAASRARMQSYFKEWLKV